MTARLRMFLYAGLVAASACLGVAKYGVYAKLLGVEEFGLYSLVLSVYVFLVYAGGLGLNEGLIKRGGLAHGRGEVDQTHRLRDLSMLYGGLTVSIVGLPFLVGVAYLIEGDEVAAVFTLVPLLALAAFEFNLLDAYFRANQYFVLFASMLFAKSLFVVSVGAYAASRVGATGAVLTEIAGFGATFLAFLFAERRLKISHARAPLGLLKASIFDGFPFMVSMVVRNTSMLMDRWVIASALGLTALGKYSFAMILYLVAMMGLGFLTNILGPRWLSDFGRQGSLSELLSRINRVAGALIGVGLLGGGVLVLVGPSLLAMLYPQYSDTDSLRTIFWVYVGVLAVVGSTLYDWFFIASSRERLVLCIAVMAVLITGAALLFLYQMGLGVVYYAASFAVVRIVVAAFYAVAVVSVFKTGPIRSYSSGPG